MIYPVDTWKWFGAPGHFICARWCRFHLCTQVGPWLISTIGEYVHPRHSGGGEETEMLWLKQNWPGEDIGFNRKYETMVFRVSGPVCTTYDCHCGQPGIDPSELDFLGANVRGDAAANHMKLCMKWAEVKDDKL